MRYDAGNHLVAMLVAVALHALAFALASDDALRFTIRPDRPQAVQQIVVVEILPPAPEASQRERGLPVAAPAPSPAAVRSIRAPRSSPAASPATPRRPASMAAPPAPTAAEWAFAATYRLRNGKGYRYAWGRQVRSMMGTAVEGSDQGMVRFRVEIAPDGTLARLETLWTTSAVAEHLARRAIERMPPLPPTPTGRPLVFDRTISFTPHAADGPPVYRDDCLPDPPSFRNPFAWDGRSPPARADPGRVESPDPQTLHECLEQLPQDSVEAHSAHDRRLRDQWDSSGLRR
ncbi:MAG: energy transducer TonB [Gammaproteobacteria bacterium]